MEKSFCYLGEKYERGRENGIFYVKEKGRLGNERVKEVQIRGKRQNRRARSQTATHHTNGEKYYFWISF